MVLALVLPVLEVGRAEAGIRQTGEGGLPVSKYKIPKIDDDVSLVRPVLLEVVLLFDPLSGGLVYPNQENMVPQKQEAENTHLSIRYYM